MEGEAYQFGEEKKMWQEFSESSQADQIQMCQGERMKVRRKRKRVKGEEVAAGPKKRRLSTEQVRLLEMNFGREHKLEAARKDRLATQLGLEPRQVAVWFQNRRVRWKCKQMEEEYVKLKKMHELVLVDKCQLEDQVLKLREQLSEAERELRKLSDQRCHEAASEGEKNRSPSSPLSMEEELATHHRQRHRHRHRHHPSSLGVGDCGHDSLFYAPESECTHYYYLNSLDEWTYLYML